MPESLLNERDTQVLLQLGQRIDPEDASAQNNLGVLYHKKGLYQQAIDQFQKALKLDPGFQEALANLEVAFEESGYYDRLITEMREVLRDEPDDRGARWNLATAFIKLENWKEARDELLTLISLNSRDAAVMAELGRVEQADGNLELAKDWLLRAVREQEDDPRFHYHLADVLYELGDNAGALAALRHAEEGMPERAEVHHLMAYVLGALGRHEEARKATAKALELDPDIGREPKNLLLRRPRSLRRSRPAIRKPDVPTREKTEDKNGTLAHYNLALTFVTQGYYREALRELRQGLERGEDRLLVLQAMAEVHLMTQDHDSALNLYDMLVADLSNSPKLWSERGVVLHQLGRYNEAIESYRKAIVIAPDYGVALNNLAVTLALSGHGKEALEKFRRALEADPELEVVQLNLGLLLLQLEEHQVALKIFRQAVERNPQSPQGWNGVGLVLADLNRPADARSAFVRAVECDPKFAEGHYNLSFAQSALGEYEAALRSVTRAQGLDPYYVPHKFRLALDAQLEGRRIAEVLDISSDVRVEDVGQSIEFDRKQLDAVFSELQAPIPAGGKEEDPYARARHYLERGSLDQASAEINRAMSRGGDAAEGNYLAGRVYRRKGLLGEALERFRVARQLVPDRTDVALAEIETLVALGRGPDAVADAEKLAQQEENNVEVLVALAKCRHAAGLQLKALDALSKARDRAPQRADIQQLQGEIALEMGDSQRAKAALEDALALEPKLVEVWVKLGKIHEQQGDWTGAAASYRSALSLVAGHHRAGLALAELYRKSDSPEQAINILVEVLSHNPSDLDALKALGHALLENQRESEALEAFQRVLAQDQEDQSALFYAGVTLARLRRYREAVKYWGQVARIDPSSSFAQKARQHARTASDLEKIFKVEAA